MRSRDRKGAVEVDSLIAITGTIDDTPIIPAAAGWGPDIASVLQPSASGQTGKRVCR